MKRGVLVYISGPITAVGDLTVEMNVALAVDVHLELTQRRIPSHCPHLVAAFPSAHKLSWELWLDLDLAIIDHCTHMLMLPNWESSKGAAREKEYAERTGMPILFNIQDLEAILAEAGAKWQRVKE